MKKLNKVLYISLFCCIILGVVGTLSHLYFNEKSPQNQQPIIYNVEPSDYIEVDAQNINISILSHDSDEIQLIHKGQAPLEISEGDNKVAIEYKSDFHIPFYIFNKYEYTLEILLPLRDYREIRVIATSGTVSAENIKGEYFDFSTKAGEITLENIKGELNIVTLTGGVNASFSHLDGDVKINTARGNIDFSLPKDTKFKVDFSTENGNLGGVIKDEPIKNGKAKTSFGKGGNKIEVTSKSGNFTINFTEMEN